MCKDFVIMFGMSQSILLDKGKDVIIILKNESESQSNVKKEIKKSPSKKTVKKLFKAKTVTSFFVKVFPFSLVCGFQSVSISSERSSIFSNGSTFSLLMLEMLCTPVNENN
jgi:hypothetical protein